MSVLVSFCLYGSKPQYCEGLLRNLALLSDLRTSWRVLVSAGSDAPEDILQRAEAFPACRVVRLPITGARLMVERFLQADEAGRVGALHFAFSRDADSRITARDLWCMDRFMAHETAEVHSVRDHLWHRMPIAGGLFGWRLGAIDMRAEVEAWLAAQPEGFSWNYGTDERFLAERIYPLAMRRGTFITHSSLTRLRGERRGVHVFPIEPPMQDDHDLVANTVLVDGPGAPDRPQFTLLGDLRTHIMGLVAWLDGQGAHEEIARAVRLCLGANGGPRGEGALLMRLYLAQYYADEPQEAVMQTFRMYRDAPVTTHEIDQSNYFLAREQQRGRMRIVGTCDPRRASTGPGELVVVYGSMPQDARCLPGEWTLWRHPLDAHKLRHDAFEAAPGWEGVDRIVVITRPQAGDRYAALLCELARVGAPLDRVRRYEATNKPDEPAYAGATRNHCEAIEAWLRDSSESPRPALIVLEDDVAFTPDPEGVARAVGRLAGGRWPSAARPERGEAKDFAGDLDFDVALLATSKYGLLEDHPTHGDWLRHSLQPCTTSAAYMVRRDRAAAVAAVIREGYEDILRTGNTTRGCVDRYWTKLQRGPGGRNGFVVVHPKVAYQRPTLSNLTGALNMTLD